MRYLKESSCPRVFFYFQEISRIPHGSGNTKSISDYLASFAKERQLAYIQDELGNVIIKKPASAGFENHRKIMIQGHMDMVCECASGYSHDFLKDGLDLYVEDGYLKARNTTLGGDDGIAVAMALAILEDDAILHPALEVVITVDEETGMCGASGIDTSVLESEWLLNIDSEEEGIFTAGCAGGLRANCRLNIMRQFRTGSCLTITLTGLKGGHSGIEIDLERANAINLLGRILTELKEKYDFSLIDMKGGTADNAIPRETSLNLLVAEELIPSILNELLIIEKTLQLEYQLSDPDLNISVKQKGSMSANVVREESLCKILVLYASIPQGIQHMCVEPKGLVETSLNAGIMNLSDEEFLLAFSIRSSVNSRKDEIGNRLKLIVENLGGSYSTSGPYSAWEFRPESALKDRICDTYRKLFNKEAEVNVIHAGLECGIFSSKMPGLECISFGPNIIDIHTPQERLDITSTERCYRFLLNFLETACER